MNKLTKLTSQTIRFICLTCIFFVWINFYINKPLDSLILAILLSIFADLFLILIANKKNNKYELKNKEIKDISLKSQVLLYSGKYFVMEFFEKTLKLKFPVLNKCKDFFYIDNENGKTFFYPFYSKFSLTNNDLLNIINNINGCNNLNLDGDKLIIFAVNYENEITSIINSFPKNSIIIFNEVSTYKKFFQKLNSYPENTDLSINLRTPKLSKQELLNIAFNKTKSKHYFFSGLILLIFSIFANYDLYYVIFSTLLFCFAIFSRYNYKFNKKEEELF